MFAESVLIDLLKGLLVLLVLLLSSEWTVRRFQVGPRLSIVEDGCLRLSDNPGLRYELNPGADYCGEKINVFGMRDVVRERRKSKGIFRIACIGGSAVFGTGVKRENAWPARLGVLLNSASVAANGPVFEVLNFAVPGYKIEQVIECLRTRVLTFSPDLVIYGFCLADIEDSSPCFAALRSKMTMAQRGYFDDVQMEFRGRGFRSRLFLIARYALWASSPAGRSRPKRKIVTKRPWSTYPAYFSKLYANDTKTFRRFLNAMEDLGEISYEHSCPILMAVFPIFRDCEDYPLEMIHKIIGKEAAGNSLIVVDLLEIFRGGKSCGSNPLCPDVSGHELIAFRLSGFCSQRFRFLLSKDN